MVSRPRHTKHFGGSKYGAASKTILFAYTHYH